MVFLNGGVSGYGTAQAILSAKEKMQKTKSNKLLVSTLVGDNLRRDQLSFHKGFPSTYLKENNNEFIFTSPTNTNIPNTKFSNITSNSIRDYLIINLTFLKKFPIWYDNIWYPTIEKFEKRIDIQGENAASIKNILKKSIDLSKRLDNKVVWLLQYPSYPTANDLEIRQMLRNELSRQNINFIDTYSILHNNQSNKYTKDELWKGHHTPLGNKIVCKTIIESKLFN